jgi:hypothetical protein
MSDYNWCHGPNCHKRHTTTRVRGVKGSKVLRTRKIPMNHWNSNSYWQYFCDQTCLLNFISEHYPEMVRLHPRTEALETPIEVSVETRNDYYNHPYKTTVIKKVDNSEQVG